jgi:quercetin dioxygenase-like cupin family protein
MRNEHLWFLNTWVTIRISHTDGDDRISVIQTHAPHGDSPPLHLHRNEDEVFQILEGQVRFQVAGEQLLCKAGDILLGRKGVPHTYRVESAQGARFLTTTTHTDFERFVRAMSRPAERLELPPPMVPSPAMIESLKLKASEFGIELLGPPLT